MPPSRKRLSDGFHPYVPVSEEGFAGHVYASRHAGGLQDKVGEALAAPGRQLLLVGDQGVGKTSLILLACWSFGLGVCRISCGNTFTQMVEEGLGRLGEWREEEEVEHLDGSGELRVGVPGAFGMRAKAGAETSRRFTAYDPGLANRLIAALRATDVSVLFLDSLEALNGKPHERDTVLAIADLMKAVADRPALEDRMPTIAVAGDGSAAENVNEIAAVIGRRAAHLVMPHMPPAELHEILFKGEQELGLHFEAEVADEIVSLSDGLPYYVHLFALHAAGWAVDEDRTDITSDDFLRALPEVLEAGERGLPRLFDEASERTGTVQLRRRVMEAMAEADEPELDTPGIRRAFESLFPEFSTSERLRRVGAAASQLVELGVLVEAEGRGAGRRFRMAHPLMRAYIRLRRREELQANRESLEGLLPSA